MGTMHAKSVVLEISAVYFALLQICLYVWCSWFLTISLLSIWAYISRDSGQWPKKEQQSRDIPLFWSSNLTKDTIRVAANFASSIARIQRKGFLASENFPRSFLQKEHAPRLPYNCTANHILGAQQSPLGAHFPSLISGSAHGTY